MPTLSAEPLDSGAGAEAEPGGFSVAIRFGIHGEGSGPENGVQTSWFLVSNIRKLFLFIFLRFCWGRVLVGVLLDSSGKLRARRVGWVRAFVAFQKERGDENQNHREEKKPGRQGEIGIVE